MAPYMRRYSRLMEHLQVEDEQKQAQIPTKGGADNKQTQELEDTIFKVSSQLSTISRMQKYFRTRENRNFSTVKSTESRIFNFSLVEVLMMAGMAALQVLVVRFFFQGARKGRCRCLESYLFTDKSRIRLSNQGDLMIRVMLSEHVSAMHCACWIKSNEVIRGY